MLCEICHLSIFNGSLAPKLSYMPQKHHADVESLLQSVSQKCFICVNIWGSCAESARQLLPIGASKGYLTTYYLNPVSGGGDLQLDVQMQAIHLVKRFCLQPVAGKAYSEKLTTKYVADKSGKMLQLPLRVSSRSLQIRARKSRSRKHCHG
jgi:hypothetical protein